MATSIDLHELIRSLTPSEKRYFRMFAERQGSGEQNYMVIFDLIEEQETYDEVSVIGQLADAKLRAQFPVQKTYLHKLILRSLRNFHNESSVDFEIKELLMNVEVLFRKNLVAQCMKQLAKAERLAIEHEKFEYLFEVNNYKIYQQLKAHDSDVERLEQGIEAIFAEIQRNFDSFQHIQALRQLSHRMLLLNRREQQALTAEAKQAYAHIMSDSSLQDPQLPDANRAKVYYLQTWFIHHFAHGDYPASYDCATRLVELMERHPYLVADRPENYINILQNKVVLSTFVCPVEESLQLLASLRSFADRFPRIRFDQATVNRVPVFAGNLELHLLMAAGLHDVAARELSDILAFIEASGFRYNLNEGYVVVDIYFKAACIYFITRDHRKALEYVNRIMNQDGLNAQFETYVNARILHVLILLESNEPQVYGYALAALSRYLRDKGRILDFERKLLGFLRKAESLLPGEDITPLLADLKASLDKLPPASEQSAGAFQVFTLQWLTKRLPKNFTN